MYTAGVVDRLLADMFAEFGFQILHSTDLKLQMSPMVSDWCFNNDGLFNVHSSSKGMKKPRHCWGAYHNMSYGSETNDTGNEEVPQRGRPPPPQPTISGLGMT